LKYLDLKNVTFTSTVQEIRLDIRMASDGAVGSRDAICVDFR